MSKMIQSLRGMKDIMDKESELFTYFIENASKIASKYGFSYLETPILEETALFKRSVGESSDIVGKEMYQFIDKGDNDVSLRPEGTAGVVRMFIQNKLDRAGGVHKYFYYGPMFRYERPQKGRLREFHQFGCESFGESSVYEDANIIIMISEILKSMGIGYKLLLNSLGDSSCMPQYREKLINHIDTLDLCDDCKRRKETNPIRVLDCKNEKCQEQLKDAPRITHHLSQECHNEFEKLKDILNQNGVSFEIDTNLVRGLDYYTKTAFEFVSDEIGSQSAIAGGGRYDRLSEFLGGRATPAVGFAIGIERLLELIKMPEDKEELIYIGAMNEDALDVAFRLANKKRATTKVISEYRSRGFRKHLDMASKKGATKVALIGENELNDGTIWTKDLTKNEEITIKQEDF